MSACRACGFLGSSGTVLERDGIIHGDADDVLSVIRMASSHCRVMVFFPYRRNPHTYFPRVQMRAQILNTTTSKKPQDHDSKFVPDFRKPLQSIEGDEGLLMQPDAS